MKDITNNKKLVSGNIVLVSGDIVAEALGVCRTTVYYWTRDKKIPYYRVGRGLRYDLNEVLESAKVLN